MTVKVLSPVVWSLELELVSELMLLTDGSSGELVSIDQELRLLGSPMFPALSSTVTINLCLPWLRTTVVIENLPILFE